MGSVPRHQSGLAGGLLAMTRTLGSSTGIAVLGTVWVARVNARANSEIHFNVTEASASIQVAGLHDVFRVIQVMIGIALVISLLLAINNRGNKEGLQN